MKNQRIKLIAKMAFAAGLTALLSNCQTVPYEGQAHDVKKKPQEEGVVAIPIKHRDEDRNKAIQRMQANCGPSEYKIIEEGEVAVGQEVKSSGKETNRDSTKQKVGSLWGIPLMSGEEGGKNTEGTQVTTAIKEWQISYKCVASNGGKKSRVK